jgi:hypothetical protein
MASSGKKKATVTKLAREQRLLERRRVKAARRDARKRAGDEGPRANRDVAPDASDVQTDRDNRTTAVTG